MRARFMAGAGRRRDPWKRFRVARWYPAEWVDGEGSEVRLTDGPASAVWPREDVEIRAAADDAWEVRAASRLSESRDGQTLDYPARLAECPEGHVRAIPTRFDAAVVELKCAECRLAYRLESPA